MFNFKSLLNFRNPNPKRGVSLDPVNPNRGPKKVSQDPKAGPGMSTAVALR